MLQFYFLSVLLNVLTGFILVYASGRLKSDDSSYLDSDVSSETDSFYADIDSDSNSEVFGTDDVNEAIKPFISFINDTIFRLVLGSVSAFVGLIKLVYTVQNDVAFIGDLIPAFAGLFGGACLLIDYIDSKTYGGLNLPIFIRTIFFGGKKYLGFLCIVAGLLHFIFPRVLFL